VLVATTGTGVETIERHVRPATWRSRHASADVSDHLHHLERGGRGEHVPVACAVDEPCVTEWSQDGTWVEVVQLAARSGTLRSVE
jgi:hypothetical protein